MTIRLPEQVEYVHLDNVLPSARNARVHSEEQVAQIAASIREFGWTVPILLGADNVIVAGHGRALAAELLGLTQVPVIRLRHLSEAQRRAYALADNRIALNGGWDLDLLRQELGDPEIADGFDLPSLGFSEEELSALLETVAPRDQDLPYPVADPTQPPAGEPAPARPGSSPVISYTLVFDDESQQDRWIAFLRFLKSTYSEEVTIAARLIRYLRDNGST